MNPKTLNTLKAFARLNNKKLRNIKRIYLSVPTGKRQEALKEIVMDNQRKVNQMKAKSLELNVAKRNLCTSCEHNGSYPICAPTEHVMVKDNDDNNIVLKCRNYNEVERQDKITEKQGQKD